MRVYARDLRGPAKVLDLDTQRTVKGVLWVDEEAGAAEAYHFDELGRRVGVTLDGVLAWRTVVLAGRFKLVHLTPPSLRDYSAMIGAPRCARCGSSLTLRGDDLCPKCKRKDAGRPVHMERCDPLDQRTCEGCSRDAEFSIADEVAATPQQGRLVGGRVVRGGAYLFDRAQCVGRRYLCRRCVAKRHDGPRTLDARGEVVSTEELKV